MCALASHVLVHVGGRGACEGVRGGGGGLGGGLKQEKRGTCAEACHGGGNGLLGGGGRGRGMHQGDSNKVAFEHNGGLPPGAKQCLAGLSCTG